MIWQQKQNRPHGWRVIQTHKYNQIGMNCVLGDENGKEKDGDGENKKNSNAVARQCTQYTHTKSPSA